MSNSDKNHYATYRGTGHTSLFLGIPLMLTLTLMGLLIAFFFVFIALLNLVGLGLFLMSLVLFVGMWAHLECAIEPRAMEIRVLELKGLFLKLIKGVKILEITSMKQTERKEVQNAERFIKKVTFNK